MKTRWTQKLENNSSKIIKWVRIILLIIIIIGTTIILTRDIWIPKLVNYIVTHEKVKPARMH
jgi:hypothetical protein